MFQLHQHSNIFYLEAGSWKCLFQYTLLEDGQYEFKRIRDSKDDINIEAQKKTRGYGLLQLSKDNKLVLPWVIDSQMTDIPCLRVDEEKHTITLNLLTQKNQIKKLMELNIVPVLCQIKFDQLVNGGEPWKNKIQLCQR